LSSTTYLFSVGADADHVVVGPAGVVVVETKYLAGRVTCLGGAGWTQARRNEVRGSLIPRRRF